MTISETAAPVREATRWRRWKWLLSGAGACAVAAAVAITAVALHGPKWEARAFSPYGNRVGYNAARAGATYYVFVTAPGSERGIVTLHGAAPHGLADTTDASFGYFLCTIKDIPTLGVAPLADTLRSCRSLVDADDARMSLAHHQLLVAITPRHAGVVVFHGLVVHYSQDGHDGSQRTGPDVRVKVNHRK